MDIVKTEEIFNSLRLIAEGWYWAATSKSLRAGKTTSCRIAHLEIVLYRTISGRVHALDAYCPHMGAHLKEGKVDGEGIRCFFHGWKIGSSGRVENIPCPSGHNASPTGIKSWYTEERFGLIWLWIGEGQPTQSVPVPRELRQAKISSKLGRPFVKECRPGVMMVNAIDAQHFNSVHRLRVPLEMKAVSETDSEISFENQTRATPGSYLMRIITKFYRERLTYDLTYWFGSTGCVVLGPDFLHFYIVFALRLNKHGQSEGQTVLLTKDRPGFFGKIFTSIVLSATQVVGDYFARGDTKIFQSIQFNLKNPLPSDTAVVRFINHLNSQKPAFKSPAKIG